MALRTTKSKIRRDSRVVRSVEAAIVDLKSRLKLFHDKVNDSQNQQSRIEANLLLFLDFSPEFTAKRSELLKFAADMERKDITVKEAEDAASRYDECQKVFQEEYCPHRFLVGYSAYEGSSSNDYDDAYPSYRACAICQTSENDYKNFKLLNLAAGDRLLYRVSGRSLDKEMTDTLKNLADKPMKVIIDFYQNTIANDYWRIDRSESKPA
ncbi:MAG: hypothetical protein G01um10143_745 [Parcubacteria group bacterium Gr01-1014_3]|nr:MAG: hypothetical protein G01um10143_745 [Parcubacteria group bacterium Gr01-1014_3]